MAGHFIVFEGGEGCGKTTQLRQIQQWLQQHPGLPPSADGGSRAIVATREPGGTHLGAGLRQLLLAANSQEPMVDRAELLLYMADRAQHVEGCLQPWLAKGAIILCDRYTDSTVAYQGYGRGFSLDLIQQLNQIATAGLESHLTLWLDVEVEVGLARIQQRGAADRMEQATLNFHQRVRQGFQELAAAHPQRIVRIDASASITAVTQQIQGILTPYLHQWYGTGSASYP
ncbi:thymidylate kinase [Neosynechococcus sphagnicola sy1]|uniref:Thymidylate kinase n=1 Tax=Neosynechococcus sphagnicola sy1 TaxID=1497020 RepID=A0A098TLN4_9CYAN|nr:dTMP kinase [Neosynechococcus sphagnicola]KGF73166.1 thymidylate kinase [Neosynechococcus sphagnicola sy1]